MEPSFYQSIKLPILVFFHLSKDAVHIHIGLAVLFMYVLLFRKPMASLKNLIPLLLVASVMELLDIWDDKNSLGYIRWSSSLHDMVNTVFWPVCIVFLAKLRILKINEGVTHPLDR